MVEMVENYLDPRGLIQAEQNMISHASSQMRLITIRYPQFLITFLLHSCYIYIHFPMYIIYVPTEATYIRS